MTIEIKEKGTKQFYKEVVNVLTQYRVLLARPDGKLKDNFKYYIFLTAAMVFLFLMGLIGGINRSFDTMKILIMVFAGLSAAASVAVYLRMKKTLDGFLSDDSSSVVTIDESGIEIEKTGSQSVRLAWDNVAFVRSFIESTCFFSKDLSGIVLAVTNDYKKELLSYIKENGIDVMVVR